jgi:DNA-directed RNA polymerase specialized sigma24 family protein
MEAGALRAPAALNRISVTAPLLRLRSDEQLVALFRAGSDAAFSVIHDRYCQRLFVYARQMLGGSRQDAEDALQDVFLRAYSSLRVSGGPGCTASRTTAASTTCASPSRRRSTSSRPRAARCTTRWSRPSAATTCAG